MTKSRHIQRRRRPWTAEQLATLIREYPDRVAKDIAARIGRPLSQVYAKARKLGLEKSAAFKASDLSRRIQRGKQLPQMIANRFKPGSAPANKGMRRPGWHRGRMRETQFKKGRLAQEAHNYVPIGTMKICKDGYLQRKVTDDPSLFPARRWQPVHRLVWIEHNGPVPDGHAIAFKPGRRTNVLEEITLDAIECVSRAEMARRNRMWNLYPREIASAIHLVGQVKRRIRQKERDAQESR